MPTVPNFISTAKLPIETAVQAPRSLARQDFTGAAALQSLGLTIQKIGVQEKATRRALAIKNQNAIDANAKVTVDSLFIIAETKLDAWKESNSPDTWAKKQAEFYASAQSEALKINMSEQALNSIKAQGKAKTLISAEKTGFDIVSANVKSATIRTGAALEAAIVDGGDVDNAAAEFEAAATSQFGEEAAKIMVEDKFEEGLKVKIKKAVDETRDFAARTPEAAIERIEIEQDIRKKGKPENFLLVSDEELLKAKKLANSAITSNENTDQDSFNLAVGGAIKGWSDVIADPDEQLIEDDVWSTDIDVPSSKQKELGATKNTWAAIARGIQERRLQISEGKKKKERMEAHDPELVAELTTRATGVTSSDDIGKVKTAAAEALSENKIGDTDLEKINIAADKTLETDVEKALSNSEVEFKETMLAGTADTALVPWLQGQIIIAEKTQTKIDTQELLGTFFSVKKAKIWAVQQARREMEEDIDIKKKGNISFTPDNLRLEYLRSQQKWLRLTDVEVVEKYDKWLNRTL